MYETIAIAAIIVAAGFLQGLTGFGFGLIALPLLGLILPIKTVVPLVVMLAMGVCITLSIQLKDAIRFRNIAVLTLATIPGIPLGTYILKLISPESLSIILGFIMISFTSYQFFAKPKLRTLGLSWTIIAGFLCGLLGGAIGAGGPPVIIYSTLQPWSKDEAKATLAFYFLITGLIIVATHALSGFITGEVINYFTISLPALAIGIITGTFAYKRISDYGYRQLAMVLVFLLGCMMILKNF